MHKTVYIDVDEEIIGIIHKIKQTEAQEVFLVVPKNSLLTQGLINLKLLKKEVAKMGKEIILVTSDAHSKKIIELVGLKTKNKSAQDFVGSEDVVEKIKENNQLDKIITSEKNETENSQQIPQKREIGSNSFYHSKEVNFSEKETGDPENKEAQTSDFISPQEESRKLKINTPNTFGSEYIDNYEAKNKKVEETEEISEPVNHSSPGEKPQNHSVQGTKINKFKLIPPTSDDNQQIKKPVESVRPSLDDFYSNNPLEEEKFQNNSIEKNSPPEKKKGFSISSKKKFIIFFGLILLTIIGIFGSWVLSNWPKMEVALHLKPEYLEKTLSLEICEEKTAGDDCLKGDYQELTVEVTERYPATGEKFSNDKGMARGIVKIYNNYSNQPQPLIATTRVLSKEGKLFRLLKTVTVPGMDEDKPGVAEVQVIADEIGQDYNISPSEFTIEGFKGGDKYDKFKVVSEEKMLGGANDIENKKVKVVTKGDIDLAREKTIEKFNQNLEKNLKEKLNSNETFVLTSIEKDIISSDSSYAPDDIIDEFSYTVKQRIRVITFNKEAFKNKITQAFEEEKADNLEFEKIAETNYQKDIANYESKRLDLTVNAKLLYWPKLNKNEIQSKLAENNNSEIKEYLGNLNQINKAIISYSPSWLSSFPIKDKNISIKEIK